MRAHLWTHALTLLLRCKWPVTCMQHGKTSAPAYVPLVYNCHTVSVCHVRERAAASSWLRGIISAWAMRPKALGKVTGSRDTSASVVGRGTARSAKDGL